MEQDPSIEIPEEIKQRLVNAEKELEIFAGALGKNSIIADSVSLMLKAGIDSEIMISACVWMRS